MPGSITSLKWIGDNKAVIEGQLHMDSICRFFVYVPGDLEYEQRDLKIFGNKFIVQAVIGRQGRDYNKLFTLKLAIFNDKQERIGEIRRSIIRQRHKINEVLKLTYDTSPTYHSDAVGWAGLKEWVEIQRMDALQADNIAFRRRNGLVVPNYRYLGYNPDEKYLTWYGRTTLYGCSILAKALLLNGDIKEAEAILRVWAAQIDRNGKIPRSANIIGDNYISPDIRTGDVSHFLGALALAKAVSKSNEWDSAIQKILKKYIQPLIDEQTGLVQGGYNGKNSEGYNKPKGYSKVPWFSAEHNFDLFQSLILISKIDDRKLNLQEESFKLAQTIGKGIDKYLWDNDLGTFNRGWRYESGPDRAKALDCSSWGALYLLKQAKLASEINDSYAGSQYLSKAIRCLDYAEKHFKTKWYYKTPTGETGSIEGYRPYDGIIDDIKWEDGPDKGKRINWDTMNDLVWSEGTLGLAKAWEEYARQYGNMPAETRSKEIFEQMKRLQSLSDHGGLLYSTKQVKGHFTTGEELASVSWLGYLSLLHEADIWDKHGDLIRWIPW